MTEVSLNKFEEGLVLLVHLQQRLDHVSSFEDETQRLLISLIFDYLEKLFNAGIGLLVVFRPLVGFG